MLQYYESTGKLVSLDDIYLTIFCGFSIYIYTVFIDVSNERHCFLARCAEDSPQLLLLYYTALWTPTSRVTFLAYRQLGRTLFTRPCQPFHALCTRCTEWVTANERGHSILQEDELSMESDLMLETSCSRATVGSPRGAIRQFSILTPTLMLASAWLSRFAWPLPPSPAPTLQSSGVDVLNLLKGDLKPNAI